MLTGEAVNLRSIERSDDRLIQAWFNTPALMRGWGRPDAVVSLDNVQRQVEEWLALERVLHRPAALVIDTLDADPVGLILLLSLGPRSRSAELSLLVAEPRWGEGIARDALLTLLGAAFDEWGLHRVQARAETWNKRARQLYTSLGFAHEGTEREAGWYEGQYHDIEVYSRLATDEDVDAT